MKTYTVTYKSRDLNPVKQKTQIACPNLEHAKKTAKENYRGYKNIRVYELKTK